MQIVIKGLTFTQKLWRENNVLATQLLLQALCKADRHRRFDHHHRIRVNGHYLSCHRLHRLGIEVLRLRIVIRGRGNDYKIRTIISILLIQRGTEVQLLFRQEALNLGIHNGRRPAIEQGYFTLVNIKRHHLMMLRQQHGIGEADVSSTRNCYLHFETLSIST